MHSAATRRRPEPPVITSHTSLLSRLATVVAGVVAATSSLARADESAPADAAGATDGSAAADLDDLDPDEIIVITGTRAETPLAASPVVTEVVDRRHIVESGAETVADALAARPGLWLERGIAGTGVTMQGLGPKYVLVLVDGQRQLGRVDGVLDLERFAAANDEQFEIVRGPGSALYGSDALGGVVNIITRAPDEEAAELTARIDHRRATDLSARVGGGSARLSGAASAEWQRGDAFDRTPETAGTTIAAYQDARGDLRGRYRGGERWQVDGSADYQRRDLRGVDATATGAILDRRNLIEVAATAARLRWTGEGTSVEARAGLGYYRDQYASDQRGSGALDQYQETIEQLIEGGAQLDRRLGDHHRASAGGELLGETLTSARQREDGDRIRGAVWLQDEWRAGAAYRWLIVPAIRVDADTQFGLHVTPRLAVRWDPLDDVAVRVSVGRGYRAPSFKELLLRFENPGAGYVVDGNPDLRPEHSTSGQAGVEWRPRRWAWISGHVYVNELRDLITTVTVDGGGAGPQRFGYDNLGRARTSGAEAAATLGRDRLALELGYAYTRARDLDTAMALDGVPGHRVSAALRWRDPAEGLTAVAEVVATGPRPYQLAGGVVETDPRFDVRARIARRFGDRLDLFLGVDNLLDAGDDQLDPIAPRTLYTGATARL